MVRPVGLCGAVFLIASLSCEEPPVSTISGVPSQPPDTVTTVPFGGTVDIMDGIRWYRNVQIHGTLTYHLTLFGEVPESQTSAVVEQIGVFLHVKLQFQRIDDYQGVRQYWHAGGKSYDVRDLQEDGTAILWKWYELGATENMAFVNIEYIITRSDVRIHNIWLSYREPG